jgi:hypothetical protein
MFLLLLYLARSAHYDNRILHIRSAFNDSRSLLVTAARAVVESAFISWIAVLTLLLCYDAPLVRVAAIKISAS